MAHPGPIEPFDIAAFVADRASPRLRLLAGEKVFLKGDAADDSMFVVLSGHVDVIVLGKVLASVGRGGILGEMAMIDCTHRSAAALAQEDAELAVLTRRIFSDLIAEEPRLALAIMGIMRQRITAFAHLASQGFRARFTLLGLCAAETARRGTGRSIRRCSAEHLVSMEKSHARYPAVAGRLADPDHHPAVSVQRPLMP